MRVGNIYIYIYIYFSCEQNKLDIVENLEYCNQNNPIYFLSPFFWLNFFFFFREFKPMMSAPDDSSFLSNQDTNQFLT